MLKNIFATLENLRVGPDLPTSVKDRVILSFCEGLIFTKLREVRVTVK